MSIKENVEWLERVNDYLFCYINQNIEDKHPYVK